MTNQPYWCPVEDCSFGVNEDKSLVSVRSHINAETSKDHDWDTLKAELHNQEQAEDAEEQREASETTPSEQGETSPEGAATDGSDSEDLEKGEEQQEPAESSEIDPAETSTDAAMASDEEYNEQYSDQDGGQDDSQNDGSQDDDGNAPAPADNQSSDVSLSMPAVSRSTLVLVAGGLVVAYIGWRLLSGDAASDYEDPTEQADDGGDTELVDVEAGTGGVEV